MGRATKLRELYERELVDWSDDDLIDVLREAYAPTEVPPCRICGGELSIQAVGGGHPTVWACAGTEEREGGWGYQAGRSAADDHYRQSRFEDRRQGGDERVVELIRRFRER